MYACVRALARKEKKSAFCLNQDIVFYLFCTKFSSQFFFVVVENFAINAQINVSFTLEYICAGIYPSSFTNV